MGRRLLIVGLIAYLLAGCGGSAPSQTSTRPPSATSSKLGCGPFPARHAFVVSVSDSGQVRWQTPLKITDNPSDSAVSPVVADGMGYFAQDGLVHALRLADGKPMWSWAKGYSIYGMWRSGQVLAVLTDQVSDHALLSGLDTRSGELRWQLRIGGMGLLGNQAMTTDGGLAWLRKGTLQVIDLTSGKVRWSASSDGSMVTALADGLVLAVHNTALTAFDEHTGHQRWATSRLPSQPDVQVVGSLVLVTSADQSGESPTALDELDPSTGRELWHFDVSTQVTPLSVGPAGLAVATYVPKRALYLLDGRTGRAVWQETTAVALDTVPAVSDQDVISVEGGVAGFETITLVDRAAATGAPRWKTPLPGLPGGSQSVLRSGPLVVVQSSGGMGNSPTLLAYHQGDGTPAWHVALPAFVQQSPVAVAGGLLVQAAEPGQACAY